ncbi:MAG: hypothetical protein ACO1RT_05580 [Planctomycetaceae bacterium]
MKLMGFGMRRIAIVLLLVAILSVVAVHNCQAQWGYLGGSTGPSRSAFSYRGPLLSLDVAPAYPASPWAGAYDPAWGTSRYDSFYGTGAYDRYDARTQAGYSSLYGRYRGMQPTQAELDRARYYEYLDRTHQYRTREDRYARDFQNAYTSPSAAVNRYRYPYVAGAPVVRWAPEPVPGQSIGRHQSRYQGYVPDDDVAISLRAASNRLQRSLSRKADGHIWIRHLKPDQIIDAIDQGQDPAVLADLVINYEGVAQTPRLVLIAETEGFQDVRRLLAQYVTLPSAYPGAEVIDGPAWQQPQSMGAETVVEDRVIDERPIIDEPFLGQGSGSDVFDQGFSDIPPSSTPSSGQPAIAPVPKPATAANETTEQSQRPRLDSLPDSPDVELLPAPLPTADE